MGTEYELILESRGITTCLATLKKSDICRFGLAAGRSRRRRQDLISDVMMDKGDFWNMSVICTKIYKKIT